MRLKDERSQEGEETKKRLKEGKNIKKPTGHRFEKDKQEP